MRRGLSPKVHLPMRRGLSPKVHFPNMPPWGISKVYLPNMPPWGIPQGVLYLLGYPWFKAGF